MDYLSFISAIISHDINSDRVIFFIELPELQRVIMYNNTQQPIILVHSNWVVDQLSNLQPN